MTGTPGSDGRSAVDQDPTLRFAVDGETVAATRYEPTAFDEPLPAVLWYTAYHKDDETTFGRYDPLLEYVAAHGYEVVVADMVGTGASTGRLGELLGPETSAEVGELVERLADREWTTGRVGMLGKSFPGAVCLAAAAENPDPLEAVVPILTTHRRERMAFHRGGLPSLWLRLTMIALYTATGVQPPSRQPPGWEDVWRTRVERYRESGPPLARTFDPDPDDEYWDWDVPVEDITIPTFAVGGYRDHFPADTVEYFAAIDAPKRLLMGPWRHVIPYQGRESAVGFRGQVVDWFDRFLKHEATEPFEPTVAYWTERDGGRQVDAGGWRGRSAWPDVRGDDTEVLSFAATPAGLEPTSAFDSGAVERTHDVDHTVGLEAHDIAVPFVDTNADDARAVTFETAPFDHPVELTGTGEATVRVAATGPVPVCVRLVDRAPDGRARPVTRGAVRADTPDGDPVTVPLAPVSHLLEEGHRLRVAISAADFPSHVPVGTGDTVVVTSTPAAPTTIRIPGSDRPPEPYEDAVSMPPPDDSLPLVPAAVADTEASWETTREHERGGATRRRRVATDFSFPHVEKSYELDVQASVVGDDQDTLSASASIETVLEYDEDEPITVATTARRDADGTTVEATIRRDGESVFDGEWSA